MFTYPCSDRFPSRFVNAWTYYICLKVGSCSFLVPRHDWLFCLPIIEVERLAFIPSQILEILNIPGPFQAIHTRTGVIHVATSKLSILIVNHQQKKWLTKHHSPPSHHKTILHQALAINKPSFNKKNIYHQPTIIHQPSSTQKHTMAALTTMGWAWNMSRFRIDKISHIQEQWRT